MNDRCIVIRFTSWNKLWVMLVEPLVFSMLLATLPLKSSFVSFSNLFVLLLQFLNDSHSFCFFFQLRDLSWINSSNPLPIWLPWRFIYHSFSSLLDLTISIFCFMLMFLILIACKVSWEWQSNRRCSFCGGYRWWNTGNFSPPISFNVYEYCEHVHLDVTLFFFTRLQMTQTHISSV